MTVPIRAETISLVPMNEIKLNPDNRNKHSEEQIARLVELIKYQGFRNPGTISNRTGILIAGEGRYLAAERVGMTHFPVIYQDFDSHDHEYAYGISDNSIAQGSVLDLSKISEDILNMGPDFDVDLLGLPNFDILPPESLDVEVDKPKAAEIIQCPSCGEQFEKTADRSLQ